MATRSNIVSFDDAKRIRISARPISPDKPGRSSCSGGAAARGEGRLSQAAAGGRTGAVAASRSASARGAAATSRAGAAGRSAKPAASLARSAKADRPKATRGKTAASSARSTAKDSARAARAGRGSAPARAGVKQAPRSAGKQASHSASAEAKEGASQSNRAFFDDLAQRHQKKKRANAKEKAERQFDRTYGKADRSAAPAEEAGPRAAVYKGEMGRAHKRSSESLNKGAASARSSKGAIAAEPRSGRWKKHLVRLGMTVAFVALACVVLYDPARMYYQQIREVARLQAEYDAIVARNDSLQASVDHLSTEAGIADAAREQLGWVNPGENAVNVSGLEEKESGFQANVVSDQVKPPDTWYSSFLDPLFGVE